MADIQWFFPNELAEVPEILSQEGVIPHCGGTGILWGNLTRIQGLMDVSRLDLKSFRKREGFVELGASLSYSEAAVALAESGNPLVRSLSAAATEPLRNRISLGGSISMFPYWSDLMGPLLALDAELTLAGADGGSCRLGEYLQNRDLRRNTLITSIRWPDTPWQGAYYRHTRTPTDRPAFSITVLLRQSSERTERSRIEELRIVVVGCKGRYRRLTELEQVLQGADLSADPDSLRGLLGEATGKLEIEFPARMGFSAEYLKHCAVVELTRTVKSALASKPGSTSGSAS